MSNNEIASVIRVVAFHAFMNETEICSMYGLTKIDLKHAYSYAVRKDSHVWIIKPFFKEILENPSVLFNTENEKFFKSELKVLKGRF